MQVAQDQPVAVDLETMTVTTPYQDRFAFALDPFRRRCLMEGLDEIGLTLARQAEITAFESGVAATRSWMNPGPIRERADAGVAVEGGRRT